MAGLQVSALKRAHEPSSAPTPPTARGHLAETLRVLENVSPSPFSLIRDFSYFGFYLILDFSKASYGSHEVVSPIFKGEESLS